MTTRHASERGYSMIEVILASVLILLMAFAVGTLTRRSSAGASAA
jgi:prepilin-type N-terminal cleavage/methylation domain-containing protein